MPVSAAADGGREPGLEVRDLVIAYLGVGPVLRVPHLALPGGSMVGIEGPSGAGKSSLLHVLGGIERPASGNVRWGEVALWSLPRSSRDRWRREDLGLVFQDMHLLEALSALDNVLLPILFDHRRVPVALRERAASLLAGLGVATPDRRAGVMSRGERQRVALARALLREPSVLLADEPTASLDTASAEQVGELLVQAAAASGASLFVATHDKALLARLPLRLRLQAGTLDQLA